MANRFTHKGQLYGDARSGGRKPWVRLRLTPSGSHWVTPTGTKFRAKGGRGIGNWPMWHLDLDTVVEVQRG